MNKIAPCLFLFLLLVACSPGAPSEAVIQTAIAATEEARPTATLMPTATLEPTSTPVPTNTPEQEGDASTPVAMPEQVSDSDAGQIYAAAIRQMYSVEHSFDDPQEFSLVYIANTTDDGTTLDVPATPPQK